MRDLGTLGGTLASVSGMNDRGEVIGMSNVAGDVCCDPFLWNGTRMIDLGGFGGGFGGTNWINEHGDVVGASVSNSGNFDGFLWRNGKLIDLPPVPGTVHAFPQNVNELDQVVGETDNADFTPIVAALWAGGRTYDLNTLIAPSSLQLASADYIDNKGDIVGFGFLPDGSQREFLLVRNPSVPLRATSTTARPLRAAHQRSPLGGQGLPPLRGYRGWFAQTAISPRLDRTR
jgi:probable HAF family extracellular repeat protein